VSGSSAPIVAEGRIVATRLYDLAYTVDLERLEREVRASATRPRLTRSSPRAVFYATPPVDLVLGRTTLDLGPAPDDARVEREPVDVDVTARIYDFGAVRLSVALGVRSTPWPGYVERVNAVEDALEAAEVWGDQLERVRALAERALDRPSEPGLEIDYLIATVERFEPALPGDRLLESVDVVPLLTGDRRPLAESARRDVLRHAYSYYANDLVVISWGRALVVEPGGDTDVADILATAHAQLLELQYYDQLLDRELPRMYDRVEEARAAFRLARSRYATLARSLHTLLAEVTEVSERIDNALVVTEDVYLAKIYRAALDQYRVGDWRLAVDRKLSIIRDTYTALYDEATAGRAEALEITIVLLIALEIVLALLVL
jgi:hypothetical protein